MLRPEFVCSLCILSKGSEVYNYVVVDRVIRCTCYIYQHILHVPGMNVFTHSFYVTIQVYDYDEIRTCLFTLLYLYYMQCTCICKIKFVLCSEVRNCLLTLLYISCTWVMILTCWCLKQFILIHLFIVHDFVVITTLLFVGLRVTYMYLYSFVLTLFSISVLYLLCYIVYLKQTTSLGLA
jgi:hypothetical protein